MAEYIYRAEPIGEGEYSHTLVGELVRCGECEFFVDEGMYCEQNIITQFDHFYCYYGERRADDEH